MQLLFTISLVWGIVALLTPFITRAVEYVFSEGTGAQQYFSQVLIDIEKARGVDGQLPGEQTCATLTRMELNTNDVLSCIYIPSHDQNYFTVTVVGRFNEVLRYTGKGRK